MKQFDLYQHASKDPEAVKVGFSWPGFGFGYIWTFVKGLWVHGFLLLLGSITIVTLAGGSGAAANIVMLAVAVFVGLRGNDWRRAKLLKEGYKHMQRVDAESTDLAVPQPGL